MIDLSGTASHQVFLVDSKGDTLIVTPTGEAFEFRHAVVMTELNAVLELLQEDDVRNLVIDLGREEYFGSVVIGAINTMISTIIDKGGKAATCSASSEMKSVIDVMGLSERWPDYPNRKKALKALSS